MPKIPLSELTAGCTLINITDGSFWRIDDRYQAHALVIFYLSPFNAPHRSNGALYELTEIDTSFEGYTPITPVYDDLSAIQ